MFCALQKVRNVRPSVCLSGSGLLIRLFSVTHRCTRGTKEQQSEARKISSNERLLTRHSVVKCCCLLLLQSITQCHKVYSLLFENILKLSLRFARYGRLAYANFIEKFSPYHAVNTLRLGYKN